MGRLIIRNVSSESVHVELKVGWNVTDWCDPSLRHEPEVILMPHADYPLGYVEGQVNTVYYKNIYDSWWSREEIPWGVGETTVTVDKSIAGDTQRRDVCKDVMPPPRYVSLENTAATKWKGWYLTANDHKAHLGNHLMHRTIWEIEERGQGIATLQAPANGGWYLDIDGNDGRVICSDRPFSGTRWRLIKHSNDTISLQVAAEGKYKNWYLDIDGNDGRLILSDKQYSGTSWKLVNRGHFSEYPHD